MRQLRALLLRLLGLFGSARTDRDLASELDGHLQLHIDDNIRAGMTPSEARRAALVKFGGIDQTKERYRDRRGVPFVGHFVQDVRLAARGLARRPVLLIATTLSIGIGAAINLTVHSVIRDVLFRSSWVLGGSEPERLVTVLPGL